MKIWNIADDRISESLLLQHDRHVKALAVSRDRKLVATSCLELKVWIWDVTAVPPTKRTPFTVSRWMKDLHLTTDGQYLIAIPYADDVIVWNLQKDRQEKALHFSPAGKGTSVGFSANALAADDRHLAISTNAVTLILRLSSAAK
jgi:WD40 repeat protein